MKASFDAEQPSVKTVADGDKIYIFIAVNGEWTERKYDEAQEPQKVWECDYREIVTTADKIDVDKVKSDPAMYLDWVEPETATDAERLEAQILYTALMTDTILEE